MMKNSIKLILIFLLFAFALFFFYCQNSKEKIDKTNNQKSTAIQMLAAAKVEAALIGIELQKVSNFLEAQIGNTAEAGEAPLMVPLKREVALYVSQKEETVREETVKEDVSKEEVLETELIRTDSKKSISQKTAPSPMSLRLATVRAGEGIEAAFFRQLINNPSAHGYDGKGDKRQWAKKEAHCLAIKAGYVLVGEKNLEVAVKKSKKVAYVLTLEDGKTLVQEFVQDKNGQFSKQSDVNEVRNTFSEAVFQGYEKTHIQDYEYVLSR